MISEFSILLMKTIIYLLSNALQAKVEGGRKQRWGCIYSNVQ